MKNTKYKKYFAPAASILFLLIVILTIYLQSIGNYYKPPVTDPNYQQEYIHGVIVSVGAPDEEGSRILKVRMASGSEKNTVQDVRLDPYNNYNDYKEGDTITVYKSVDTVTGSVDYGAVDYFHMDGVIYIFIIFVLAALAVAGKKGLRAILTVLASLVFFYFFFIKIVGIGFSPVLGAIIFVAIVTLISIPLIHGLNRKSLASIIAIFAGYAASILIVYLFSAIAHLGASPGEDFRMLGIMFGEINLTEVLLASLFLGAVGALIDTAISISSAIFETLQEAPRADFKKVYKIGMNVGKDVLGSMINTLLFAYIASSLPFFIMLTLAQENGDSIFYDLMNMDFIALELTRIFIGAVSLVIIIPLVSITSAYYLTKGKAA